MKYFNLFTINTALVFLFENGSHQCNSMFLVSHAFYLPIVLMLT